MANNRQDGLGLSVVGERAGAIWKDVLGVPEGREDATFFELQGQSISAVRIVARVEDELDVHIDASLLFDDPDLETFVRMVVAAATRERTAVAGEL